MEGCEAEGWAPGMSARERQAVAQIAPRPEAPAGDARDGGAGAETLGVAGLGDVVLEQ